MDMAHTARDKKKLISRINRIRGQLDGVARALEEERDCGEVLLTIASCRGAINALMAEVMEGHVREHLLPARARPGSEEAEAAEEIIEVIRRYLR